MLQIADDALDALRQIGTIRIRGVEAAEDEIELEIEEAEEPLMEDQVVERDGVKVYLDPVAANALEDQILGIHSHGDHFHFTFDEQQDAAAGGTDS
jgi:Fe-S cluster assembly iron-binding protein IscA